MTYPISYFVDGVRNMGKAYTREKIHIDLIELRKLTESVLIDPFKLAEYEKIRIVKQDFSVYQEHAPDLLGFYAIDKDGKDLICYRSDVDNIAEIRKIIAHELAHYYINKGNPDFTREKGKVIDMLSTTHNYGDPDTEDICEEWAQELLMPEIAFKEAYNHLKLLLTKEKLVERLESIFCVPRADVRKKLNDLFLEV
jgi:Zn-dependent peptidase ImmA (M78 family)